MMFILTILAAILNACMDRVETKISFSDSVFWRRNPYWWCKAMSANKVKFIRFTKYRPDFWHLCKSGMICSLLAIPMFYSQCIHPIIDYVILGVLYNVTFEQFYSRILKSRS